MPGKGKVDISPRERYVFVMGRDIDAEPPKNQPPDLRKYAEWPLFVLAEHNYISNDLRNVQLDNEAVWTLAEAVCTRNEAFGKVWTAIEVGEKFPADFTKQAFPRPNRPPKGAPCIAHHTDTRADGTLQRYYGVLDNYLFREERPLPEPPRDGEFDWIIMSRGQRGSHITTEHFKQSADPIDETNPWFRRCSDGIPEETLLTRQDPKAWNGLSLPNGYTKRKSVDSQGEESWNIVPLTKPSHTSQAKLTDKPMPDAPAASVAISPPATNPLPSNLRRNDPLDVPMVDPRESTPPESARKIAGREINLPTHIRIRSSGKTKRPSREEIWQKAEKIKHEDKEDAEYAGQKADLKELTAHKLIDEQDDLEGGSLADLADHEDDRATPNIDEATSTEAALAHTRENALRLLVLARQRTRNMN